MPLPFNSAYDIYRIFRQGYANPTRYTVRISLGPWATNTGLIQTIMLNCEAASLPGTAYATNERRLIGPVRKFPYTPQYQDVTLSFYISADYREKAYFDNWFKQVNPQISGDDSFNFYNDYISTVEIYKYDNRNRYVHHVRLLEAFPIAVSPVEIGYSQSGTVERMSVTFAYFKHYNYFNEYEVIGNVPPSSA